MARFQLVLILCWTTHSAAAATIRVPADHSTVQAAIDAAQPGDIVQVAAGRYSERLTLRPGVVVRSAGNDAKGKTALERAEATIIDGGGERGDKPGVLMAAGSTLDGFTVTNVGTYDEALWKKHFDSQGEDLADDEGSVQAEGTVPAISVRGTNCTVSNNVVHHNGDVGIAVLGSPAQRTTPLVERNHCYRNLGGGIGVAEGAEPIVRENVCHENLRAGIGCRKSSPLVIANTCYQNIRAGIGCREGARPIMRGNTCYHNRRAGIGIRGADTAPLVDDNDCYENDLAGIGCRDEAQPVMRNNRCRRNKMAGIGCDGASPLIVGNRCEENVTAGIGVRGAGDATIQHNKCVENKLVAIGVTDGSTATLNRNHLVRTGGVPPLVAVKEATATVQENRLEGGGVAAILVQGTARIHKNHFQGQGEKQGLAVWVWEGSTAVIADNHFAGYRTAVRAAKATITIADNRVELFVGPAFAVTDSVQPAHVFGNTGVSRDPQAEVVALKGASGIVANNQLQAPAEDKPASDAKPTTDPKPTTDAKPPAAKPAETKPMPTATGLKATPVRDGTHLQFLTDGAATVIDVVSETGIDKTTLQRTDAEWPNQMVVRLHLRGLESFKVRGQGFTVEWSVDSSGDHAARVVLTSGKRVAQLKKDNPFFSEVKIVGEKVFPLKDGAFEVPLPARLFEGNPESIALEWVDFYR